MPLSLSQRSVTLGFLLLVCVGATALLGMTATGQSPDLTLAPVAAFTLAFYVLAAVYWRGWEPARYLTVIASSLAIGLEMPAVNFTGPTIPQSVLLPAVVALLLADSRWVVVNTLLTGGLLLWRAEGQGALVQPSNLITLVVTVGGLLLSRAMLDQARRQAEANARQARAQAEEVQRKNDSIRFQAELLDNVGQAVIAVLFDGRIIYRNPAARGFYGWAEEEAAAVGIDALLPGELSAEARAAIRAALRRGEAWTGEALMRRRDGSPLPVLAKLTPLREAGRQVVG